MTPSTPTVEGREATHEEKIKAARGRVRAGARIGRHAGAKVTAAVDAYIEKQGGPIEVYAQTRKGSVDLTPAAARTLAYDLLALVEMAEESR